ncbi:nuclear transport factor 2 family protein [Pseudonocardia sp. GCM10023141]|uniref:nuclear transport factor 2 family protein n=1 Tax=Pseudonocardia sp. GCM10023141 TaxID=3252653 RepID=UPI00361E8CAC
MSATPRAVLVAYLDALTAVDLASIEDSFAEDATWWLHGDTPLAGMRHGRAEIMEFLTSAGVLFVPGTQEFTFGDIVAGADRAVLEWSVRGRGAATGLDYANEYCGVFVVRDGRISEVREYLDTHHAAQVLFGSPSDGPAAD